MEGIEEHPDEGVARASEHESLAETDALGYDINTIREDDHHEDEHLDLHAGEDGAASIIGVPDASAMTGNMRPLVTMTGEVSGWMECSNAEGETYYCNLVSGETSWTPPFPLLAPVDELLSSRSGLGRSGSVRDTLSTSEESRPPRPTLQLLKRVLDGSLRRLDPHTQMQLEEARRRHHELEELRDEEVLMGGEHWVEMYDPTHDGFYYYGTQSGEMRWDRPDSYVMKVESDDVLRMVVRLQCVFRMKLARRRVFQMKVQRGLIQIDVALASEDNPWVEVYDPFHKVLYYYCSSTGETRWDPPEHYISASEDREMAAAIAIQSMSRSHLARRELKKRRVTIRKKQHEQAVEEAKKLREIRRREYFAKTDDERESVCRREMLEEEMEQIRDGDSFWGLDRHDQEVLRQAIEEKLLSDAEAFWQRVNATLRLNSETELKRSRAEEEERSASERISQANEMDRMAAAEAEQCLLGDCFWGIQAEERREEQTRHHMFAEDAFSRVFGARVDLENQHRDWADEAETLVERTKKDKVLEEKRFQRQYFKWFYNQCTTGAEVLDYLWPTKQRYIASTLDDDCLENSDNQLDAANTLTGTTDIRHAPVGAPPLASASNPNASKVRAPEWEPQYVLDDIVMRERLENEYRYAGKSIYTIHDPNGAKVLGRRGRFVVSFLDTEPAFAAAAKKADFKPRSTSPTRPMPASSYPVPNDTEEDEEARIKYGVFPGIHYQRAETPDPHLPARFNGVPYRPSEMSETRDILLGQHTKQTQLPSLHLPTQESSPSRQWLAKKKPGKGSTSPVPIREKGGIVKPAKKKNSAFMLALQQSNNQTVDPMSTSFAFASPFLQEERRGPAGALGHLPPPQQRIVKAETDDERLAREEQERVQRVRRKYATQFEREELGIVEEVFGMMDYDGSGTIDKKEMVWALQRDGEVHALAKRSSLLRLLLKQQSHLEELFRHLRMGDGQRDEISWDIFRIFCEEMYIQLMEQGILTDVGVASATKRKRRAKVGKRMSSGLIAAKNSRKASVFMEAKEEKLIRRIFELCDQDGNQLLEVEELQNALYKSPNEEIQTLVRKSKALQPLLHEGTFIQAFKEFEPANPRGISEEEFVVFCLEIAEIAMLNGML